MQRVASAGVTAVRRGSVAIGPGLLVLVAIAPGDTSREAAWMARKVAGLRIFGDADGRMNLSVKEREGEVLVVSQFTLYGDASRGMRPGFTASAGFEEARPLYEAFVAQVEQELGRPVPTGWYGESMQVSLVNDGPITIIIDSPLPNP